MRRRTGREVYVAAHRPVTAGLLEEFRVAVHVGGNELRRRYLRLGGPEKVVEPRRSVPQMDVDDAGFAGEHAPYARGGREPHEFLKCRL
ncbi:hypothetical protein SDC9_149065 [bioreactor metagenome]|uniref:Uncharacterized protein n=1 Tax=bioreactor metagenome TaxID=1076179 RepID=A0A645EMU2_9ZZZZ